MAHFHAGAENSGGGLGQGVYSLGNLVSACHFCCVIFTCPIFTCVTL